MKTYLKDYSIEGNALINGCSELEEVINNRQEKFMLTTEYQNAKDKAEAALREIMLLLPAERKIFMDVTDAFFTMESICFSAGYRDGMSDLMASMTLNKLGLTRVEYYDLRKGA
ncbi:hypothetical protein [Desulfosporosinus lacus]|uniref:Uncharacterized protein n=1 Tax=Desulfosporosinus lacus DSM 15449 TaxID=1121420 RepID=A0A1M5WFA5_9FIRM|nr:hypothetical protein [Desulfosporosinus lacus]SHH86195.1 hypothetical protein SAMN02746098_01592 [Desulfosporosinus lacus DSM 15449]